MNLPKKESEIIAQINKEYNYWFSVMQKKLIQFTEQDKLLNWIDNKDKIDLKTAYYLINTMMAVYYSDQLEVRFTPFSLDWERQAKNMNYLAKFLHKEMWMNKIDYEVQLNRLMRWVWIKILTNFNNNRNAPVWKAIDTRQWIPDPNVWWERSDAQFHWFKRQVNLNKLKADWWYENLDKLEKWKDSWSIYQQVNAQSSAWLNPSSENEPTDTYEIYDHMTIINGEKRVFATDYDRKYLIRAIKILPVYASEKKDPTLINFPVVLDYFEPKKYDVCGTNVMDLIQVPHRYLNIFANLMFIREKDLALWDPMLFDAKAINVLTLTTPTINKLLIPVDVSKIQGWNIQNSMSVAPRNPASQSTYQFTQYLNQAIEKIVAIDSRQMWIPWDRPITLWEAQQLQANNNLKTRFRNVINFIAQEDFRKDTMRAMKENFPKNKKMLVRVIKSYWNKTIQFEWKDFITDESPDVEIVSRSELQAKNDKMAQTLTPLLLATMNNPSATQFARNQANRKMYQLSWLEEEETLEFVNHTFEELDALKLLPLLDANDMDWAKIDVMDVDHNTYIQIFQRWLDTPAKNAAIEARKDALIEQWQNKNQQTQWGQPQWGWQEGNSFNNMAASQMMNNSQQSQEWQNNVITRWQ